MMGGEVVRTEQVKYFLETAKTGSFTRAAENLHIQQPSLREAIINLENELGEELFIRSKKGVELSTYGRYCLPMFQQMVDIYDKIKYPHKSLGQLSVLSIDAQSNFDTFMAAFYRAIKLQLHNIELELNTNNDLDGIANRLMQNQIDLAFVCVVGQENTSAFFQKACELSLENSELSAFKATILMREHHPLAAKKVIEGNDLSNYPVVLSSCAAPITGFFDKTSSPSFRLIKMSSWKLVEDYLLSTDAITITQDTKKEKEHFAKRPFKNAPKISLQALYKKGRMSSEITQCINAMKIIIDEYI